MHFKRPLQREAKSFPNGGGLWSRMSCILIGLLFCCVVPVLHGVEPFVDTKGRLQKRILQVAKELKIPEADLSYSIRIPELGLISHMSMAPRIPASTMKLVVAAAAWERLGPDFLFKTDLLTDGPVSNGTLEGNLYVVGRGDPAVVGRENVEDVLWELRPWCSILKKQSIESIRGKVLADVRYFSGSGFHSDWRKDSAQKWYYASSGALNLNDNCLDLWLGPLKDGAVMLDVQPVQPLASLTQRLKLTEKSSKHLIRIDRRFSQWDVAISGTFYEKAGRQKFHVTVPDPASHFVGAFSELLSEEGLKLLGQDVVSDQPLVLLDSIQHSLQSRTPVLLKNSQNLYADSVFRVLGRESGGDGSFESSAEILKQWVLENYDHTDHLVFRDGSGLSRKNRLTSRFLLEAVERALVQDWSQEFIRSLAVAGVDGTLKKRLKGEGLKGRVYAKTGSLTGVSSLAGAYWPSDDAEPVTFAMICNRKKGSASSARKWQDRVLEAIRREIAGN